MTSAEMVADSPARKRFYAANQTVNMTETIAERAATRASRVTLRDEKSGVELIVSKTGTKTWTARVRANGKQHRISLGAFPGQSYTGAVAALSAAKADLSAGGQRAKQVIAKDTVEELVDIFRKRHLPNLAATTQREYQRYLNLHIVPKIGSRRLRDVERADLIALIDEVHDSIVARDENAVGTEANRVAALLGKLFTFAVDRSKVSASPAVRLPKPAEEAARQVTLTDDQLRILWSELSKAGVTAGVAVAIRIALVTGQRIGTVAAATLGELDLENSVWLIPGEDGRKGDTARPVPLSQMAANLWQRAIEASDCKGAGSPIFPAGRGDEGALRVDSLDTAYARIRERHKALAGSTPHDLRRTMRTRCAQLGLEASSVKRLIGHVVGSKVDRTYDTWHYLPQMRHVADAWTLELRKILSEQPPKIR